MLSKVPLHFNVRASSHQEIWTQYFKNQSNFHITSFSSPVNLDSQSVNIWLLEPHLISKLPKATGVYNIFILFYEKQLPFQKLVNLLSHGILYLISSISRKADIEKTIKSFINEISENWIILHPEPEKSFKNNYCESAPFIYLHQLAKKIALADDTICFLDEDNAEFGFDLMLFTILKSNYLPALEFSTYLHSSPNLEASSRKFISCRSTDFLNFITIYPLSKNSFIYIKNVKPEDYHHHEISKKTILLPKLSDFQNCTEFMLTFLSDYLLQEEIFISKKAHNVLIRNSYFFHISDYENLLKKISGSKTHILTENTLMLFLEGGKKNLQNNFAHYFSQVLTSNAIMWKRGTIYDAGKSFLEKSLINNALNLCNKHKKNTAKILGINRNTLREKNITR